MKTIIACILCLIFQYGASEVPPVLDDDDVSSVSLFASQPCIDGQVIRCTDDCKGRHFCMSNQETIIDCYKQTGRSYCNKDTLECTTVPNSGDCQDKPYTKCPGIGYYPHALNCSKILYCGTNETLTLSCGNLVFDPLNKQCKSSISCYTFSPTNGLCKGKEGAIVVHPLNKAIYAHCSGTFPQIGECPPNHTFNTMKLRCEFQCQTVGRFVDPQDPGCYYSCTRPYTIMISEHICCEPPLEFNPDILTCSPPVKK